MMCYQGTFKKLGAIILTLLFSMSLHAEDIEMFSNEVPPSKPNLLFLLDHSGSMASMIETTGESRLSALHRAFEQVVANPELTNINIGLIGFSNIILGQSEQMPYPHGVSFPVSPIDALATPLMLSNLLPTTLDDGTVIGYFTLDDDNLPNPDALQTVRSYLPSILSTWGSYGATPIVDAFHEAALYFRGSAPKWGAAAPNQLQAAHPSTYSGAFTGAVSQKPTGSTYSCFDQSCGINCTASTTSSVCATGESSCGLGTNCVEATEEWSYSCDLGTEAECLASNTNYTSCTEVTYESCSLSCDGVTDPVSGLCMDNDEVEDTFSCSDMSYYSCNLPMETVRCDHTIYSCEAVEELVEVSGTAKYTSPITSKCQSNAIILLSDGQPYSSDEDALEATRGEVKSLVGHEGECAAVEGQVLPKTTDNSLADGRCGAELAKYLATTDQSADVEGDNVVNTYTVGFGVAEDSGAENYLRSLADNGGGKYFAVADSAALVQAFTSIIGNVDTAARSYSAPVYTVDTASLLAHSNDIYLPLFANSPLPSWSGNLKKFRLNAAGKIVDRNNVEAIDARGVLKASAEGFWSVSAATPSDEQNAITTGGAASRLDPASRKLFTDDGSSSLVALDSTHATKALLGNVSMSDAYQQSLLKFIRGYQEDGATARQHMGDILHSKPTVVSYASEQVVFFGTNEGYLHAINAADASTAGSGGREKFAFMPSSLLKNIDGLLKNTELTGDLKRIYGVDGAMTVWIKDNNKNGKVDVADGDTAYLYFGLRRGGNHLYALDITNPNSPSLLWKISNTDVGFSQLGETWSKPVVAKLRYKPSGTSTAVTEDVLVFGGGYDARVDQEDRALRSSLDSAIGNAVYIVNAKTKKLIWSYSGGNLKHSVPGNIRVLDLDRNGSIDRLYFGDTGGNIWRADLNVDDVDDDVSLYDVSGDARVSLFASLGGAGTDYRKFFYEPDVSFFKHKGRYVLLIAVGSGYRAHPLNTKIDDRFYVLYDENVLNIPDTPPTAITESDLASSAALAGNDFLPSYKGWYKALSYGRGEKALASPMIFMNKVIFTTFATTDTALASQADDCSTLTGNQTRAYVLDLMSASATVDLDGSGSVTAADEAIGVPSGDILDSPQLVFNEPSNCTKDGCNQYVDIRVGKRSVPLVDENTVNGNIDLGKFLPKVYWLNN